MTRYRYGDRVIEVIVGLGGDCWMSGWCAESGGTHRLVSKYLPVRNSRIEAEVDLDSWAGDHGLEAVK